MSQRPFDLASLPFVAGGDVGATRRAAVRFGEVSRRIDVTVARFGGISLTFAHPVAAVRPEDGDSVWRLRRGGEQGWLLVGNAGGLRIVSAILGVPSPRIHRAMGTTERGVLAAAISSVLRLVPDLALAGARGSEWRGGGLARVEGRADSETFREAFFLDVPPAWIPALQPERFLAQLRQRAVSIPVSVALARTVITADEWARARPGDAVVFDSPLGDSEGDTFPVQLTCGAFAAPARLTASGALSLIGSFAPNNVVERKVMANVPEQNLAANVIAQAPIEVVAELGRMALRADEVASLREGSLVTLPPDARSRIELRVADRPWATGELVSIDGELGVRVTALAAPAAHADQSEADTVRR
jgi:type III secretion system YscQ/HrcQ family protein